MPIAIPIFVAVVLIIVVLLVSFIDFHRNAAADWQMCVKDDQYKMRRWSPHGRWEYRDLSAEELETLWTLRSFIG